MDNKNYKVSVIIPVYNAAEYLRATLESVINQTLSEIEIICVNDGSTDGSLDIINEYKARDGRISVITEANSGPAAARCAGLEAASGEYVAFLDADDIYEPELLSTLYSFSKENNLDISVAKYDIYHANTNTYTLPHPMDNARIFENNPITSKNEYPDYILGSTTGYVWNKLFKREFLIEKGIAFLPELHVFEDIHFVMTALSVAERVGKVQKILVHHRVYPKQARVRIFRKHYREVPLVYKRIKEYMMRCGMYIPLLRSFLNLSASRCYTIYNLLWQEAKREFWDLLHYEYAEELGWHLRGAADFDRRDVCEFAMNLVLYDHNTYINNEYKGKKPKIEGFEKQAKRHRIRNKIASLFRKKQ